LHVFHVCCMSLQFYTGVNEMKTLFHSFPCILSVQISSETHPASYPMGTGDPFPGVKRGRGVTLIAHPHLVRRSRMNRNYTSSPPWRLHDMARQLYFFLSFFSCFRQTRKACRNKNKMALCFPIYNSTSLYFITFILHNKTMVILNHFF
jgi:hypothetical protein